MYLGARIITGLLAIIGLVIGARGALAGLAGVDAPALLDNEYRFFAGIWFAVGLGLAYCVVYLKEAAGLFRGLMLALFCGGIARAIGLTAYAPEPPMVAAIAIELIAPVLLVWMQARLVRTT